MSIRRVFVVLTAAAVLWLPSANVQAGLAVDSLVDGIVNELEDVDNETLVNADYTTDGGGLINSRGTGTTVDIGDYLVGIYRIETLNAPPDGSGTSVGLVGLNSTFTGIFIIEVTGKSGGGGSDFVFEFGPADDAIWTAVGATRNDPNTMLVMYEENGFNPDTATNANPGPGNSATFIPAAIDSASDDSATLLWEFGMPGDAGEFWKSNANTDDVTNPPFDIDFAAALNLTFGDGLGKFNYLATAPVTVPFQSDFTDPTHFQFKGFVDGLFPTSALEVRTDSELYIKPVPEAGTFVIWSLLGLAASFGTLRKRLSIQKA